MWTATEVGRGMDEWLTLYYTSIYSIKSLNLLKDCLNANQINLLRKEVDLLILKILARLGRNSADVHVVVVEECGCVLEPIELNLKLQTKRQSSPTAVRKSFIDCPYEYTRFRAKSMNNSHCQSMLHRLLFEKMASIATEVLEIEETAARMSPIKNKAKLGNHYHEEIIMESSSSSPSGLGGGGGGGDDPPTPPASGCKSTSSNIPSTSNSDSDCKTFIHHVYLFNEQYIVKPPHNPHSASTSTSFPWHRDDMHQPTPSAASTISFWVPLDKTTPENGTLTFLPLDKTPSSVVDLVSLESHLASPAFSLNHLATINVPPGMIVVISPRVWHCSNANVTDKIRRCW